MRAVMALLLAIMVMAGCSRGGDRKEEGAVPYAVTASFTARYEARAEACIDAEACTKLIKVSRDSFEIIEKNEREEHRFVYRNGVLTKDGMKKEILVGFVDLLGRRMFWQLREPRKSKPTGESRKICGRPARCFRRIIDDNSVLAYRFEYWLDSETNVVLEGTETTLVNRKPKVKTTWVCQEIEYTP